MTPRTAVTWYSHNYLIFPTHRHRTFYSKASRVIFGYARAFMACNQILLANRDLGAIRHSTPAGRRHGGGGAGSVGGAGSAGGV